MKRTLRPCLTCGTLTNYGNRCNVCGPRKATEWAKNRGPSPYRSADWRRLSVQKRKEVPYCELCGQRDGDVSNPLTADHIQPMSEGGALIVPTFMLRTLCRVCHGKITKHRRTS